MKKLFYLIECMICLGFKNGYRYWKLHNYALINPDFVLELADKMKIEAVTFTEEGDASMARLSSMWEEELRKSHKKFTE